MLFKKEYIYNIYKALLLLNLNHIEIRIYKIVFLYFLYFIIYSKNSIL